MANQSDKIRTQERLVGVAIVAAELGVRREWVWAVRVGRGTSARVADALARHGIRCKPVRRASTH